MNRLPLNLVSCRSAQELIRRGFTLMELLVTISIIGILAAILMPTLSKSKEKARASQCINNEKQINLAVLMYADDHQGYLPSTRGVGAFDLGQVSLEYLTLNATALNNVGSSFLIQKLATYTNVGVFLCPTATANWGINSRNMSYICNDHLGWITDTGGTGAANTNSAQRKLLECTTPSLTTLFGGGRNIPTSPPQCFPYIECWPRSMWPGTVIGPGYTLVSPPLHSSLANMAYADGHVAGENLGTLTNKCSSDTPGGSLNNIWDLAR